MQTLLARAWAKPALILLFFTALVLLVSVANLAVTAQEIQRPITLDNVPYAQSTTCINCHPGQYESWYNTYHRTMTQKPSSEAVLGDFEEATYVYQGVRSRFTNENGRYFIETLSTEGQMAQFEVAMTIGSRRIQQYVTRQGDRHIRLPLAWNIEDKRWFHLNGGFLDPDGTDFNHHTSLWDANCIFCHNVKAQPGYDFVAQTFDSQVAELGIACEACHGPGHEHIQRNSNPLRRYLLYVGDRDPTLYSPHELPEQQQIQLCGHCHGQRLPHPRERIEEFVTSGDPFTVGDDLNEYTMPMMIDTVLDGIDVTLRFWANGTPRLTAYEYQGLLLSNEHKGSGLTCTSCHNMHGGDPKGMIDEAMRGAFACTQCHSEIEENLSDHTKHAPDSSGSDCYACHMPDIVYGVLDIHPTHHIENPDPNRIWQYEMPDACTLCHTNETAVWAIQTFAQQYQAPLPTELPITGPFTTAESIRTLLSGDPIQRGVAIHALTDDMDYTDDPIAKLWAVPFLLISMEDSYPAIRYFAYRGLQQLLDQTVIVDSRWRQETAAMPAYDYLAPIADRTAAISQWWQWWQSADKQAIPHPGTAVPLDEALQPQPDIVQPLLAAQAQKSIQIGE